MSCFHSALFNKILLFTMFFIFIPLFYLFKIPIFDFLFFLLLKTNYYGLYYSFICDLAIEIIVYMIIP